jgi:hypothetical protein
MRATAHARAIIFSGSRYVVEQQLVRRFAK